MAETITARDANQNFSKLLRDVAAGREFIITRSGTPVARLAPIAPELGRRVLTPEQREALAHLIDRARNNKAAEDAEPTYVDRNEIYDERIPKRLRDRDFRGHA